MDKCIYVFTCIHVSIIHISVELCFWVDIFTIISYDFASLIVCLHKRMLEINSFNFICIWFYIVSVNQTMLVYVRYAKSSWEFIFMLLFSSVPSSFIIDWGNRHLGCRYTSIKHLSQINLPSKNTTQKTAT